MTLRGGHADLIKGKVSSSIAQLYRRPRVWLEGYHSLGWSAAPERLMQATCENFVYGCNLLNLHGLYYTTHGGFWEWAPPCYHFRMPYWEHMGIFLKYFERLSYVLSQGVHQCDIALLYPVSPGQAGLAAKEATDTAFEIGTRLFESGRDFIFLDDESLDRARIDTGRLTVSDATYRVLVLPAMRAVRWTTLKQAQAFYRAGGTVIAFGALPEASDRAGADDPELNAVAQELFGATAAQFNAGTLPAKQTNPAGGVGTAIPSGENRWSALAEVLRPIPLDVASSDTIKATHRRIGPRDVYLVMGASQGSVCTFRTRGRAEWWDPWTGTVHPIHATADAPEGTRVRMPLGSQEAQLIVFSPGKPEVRVPATELDEIAEIQRDGDRLRVVGYTANPGPKSAAVEYAGRRMELRGQAEAGSAIPLDGEWECELKPTLDNRWGDFRLPVTQPTIGPEARIFRYAEETTPNPGWQFPAVDDAQWPRVTAGFGQQFWKLGPMPVDPDPTALDQRLAGLSQVDPAVPIAMGNTTCAWSPYAFSWRWGKEGDPGHQGWHGLKKNVTDDFICLGKPTEGMNETLYREEPGGKRYYLWTTAPVSSRLETVVQMDGLRPSSIYVSGRAIPTNTASLWLEPGPNPILLRYDSPGRGHFVLRSAAAGEPQERTPLAMKWYDAPGVVRFDVRAAAPKPAGWYRFTAPPGLRAMIVTAQGSVQAWVDGAPCRITERSRDARPRGARTCQVELDRPRERPAAIALRVEQDRGCYGGAALPEPVLLECGPGRIRLGDWSQGSALECYSGGLWYRRNVPLEKGQTQGRVQLDLGAVVATAEVRVNGQAAGVRVAPPWVVDISQQVKPGENRVEVLVYNTLANHYLTIPTRYRGELRSGLLGPVQIRIQPRTTLSE